MKIISVLLLFLVLQSCAQSPQARIDAVESDDDVLRLIQAQFPDKKNTKYSFQPYAEKFGRIADSLGVKYWEKTDLDGDGEQELIVYHASPGLTMLTFYADADTLRTTYPYNNRFAVVFPTLMDAHPGKRILLNKLSLPRRNKILTESNPQLQCDTLVFRNRHFQEYNAEPTLHRIEKMVLRIQPSRDCFMDCLTTELTIDGQKGNANCILTSPNGVKVNGSLGAGEIRKCLDIAAYMKLGKPLSMAPPDASSSPEAWVEITYDGGKRYVVTDIGLAGGYSLCLLYSIALNKIQWKE